MFTPTGAFKNSEKSKSLSLIWLFAIPWTLPARLLCPWDSPDKNTGVGSCSLQEQEWKKKKKKEQ